MKLSYFSVHVSYNGNLTGTVQFIGDSNVVTHTLTQAQTDQLSALVNQWRVSLLDVTAADLIQARDDILALEHAPPTTDSEDSIPF